MKKVLRNEEGFTLIEIIAVLVILGVLAAVAVPKYLTLMADSKKKAAEGALAAAVSNVTMQYAAGLMSSGATEATALTSAIAKCGTDLSDLGDYSASYSGAGTGGVGIYVSDENDANASTSRAYSIY